MLFSKPLERGEAFGAACLLADAPPHAAALVALGEVQCLCLTAQSCADITTAFQPQLQRRSADLLERARGSKAARPLRPPPCRAARVAHPHSNRRPNPSQPPAHAHPPAQPPRPLGVTGGARPVALAARPGTGQLWRGGAGRALTHRHALRPQDDRQAAGRAAWLAHTGARRRLPTLVTDPPLSARPLHPHPAPHLCEPATCWTLAQRMRAHLAGLRSGLDLGSI